jgi:hypothetical protein
LQIDTPRSRSDFEQLRWYIAHEKVSIFKEKRKWFLEVGNGCRFLTGDHECSIYEKRPDVCREHDTETCERDNDLFDHELFFDELEALDSYIAARFGPKKGR